MPQTAILTPEQLEAFDRRGVLRLPSLLSAERVDRAREYVQRRLALLGLWRDGAWRLDGRPRPRWPDSGVKASKAIGNKHPDVEALIEEPALLAAVNVLLDGRPFDRSIFPRPQLLITLPNADRWTAPTGWHADAPRLASGGRPGLQLFACLDTVEPHGGGTVVVAGSHQLLNDGVFLPAREMRRLLCREAFFRELFFPSPASGDDRLQRLGQLGARHPAVLELIELTGAPGDAWLVDMRVLHASAPNASDRPRIMATHRFMPEAVVKALGEAYNWT